jgi:hypothetical protein
LQGFQNGPSETFREEVEPIPTSSREEVEPIPDLFREEVEPIPDLFREEVAGKTPAC